MSMLSLDNARGGFFEADQFEAVVRHLPEHLKPVAQVAYLTGWRRSELLSRQWRHIDLKLGWLNLEPGETKNLKGRSFPFHNYPELRAVIEAQRERVSEIEKATGSIIPWVFISPAGVRLADFRNSWKTACRAAGCPRRLLHDFRRTAIRNFERRGVSRSAGMALSGHLTASVYSRYAITDAAILEEAVEKLTMSQTSDQKSPSRVKVAAFPVKNR
jgi:integrase